MERNRNVYKPAEHSPYKHWEVTSCPKCGKTFYLRSDLKFHFVKHAVDMNRREVKRMIKGFEDIIKFCNVEGCYELVFNGGICVADHSRIAIDYQRDENEGNFDRIESGGGQDVRFDRTIEEILAEIEHGNDMGEEEEQVAELETVANEARVEEPTVERRATTGADRERESTSSNTRAAVSESAIFSLSPEKGT